MNLQTDRLAHISELVSCLEANEFLEENEDEDADEHFVNMKGEELAYLTSKQFAHKTFECQLESTAVALFGDATVENVGKIVYLNNLLI